MPKKSNPHFNKPYEFSRDALRNLEQQAMHDAKNAVLYGASALSMSSDALTQAASNESRCVDEQLRAKQELEKRLHEAEQRERESIRKEIALNQRMYQREAEQRAARHERARFVLQRVHINRADSITVIPGDEATATAIFDLDVESKADISSIVIGVRMPWANVDEATKMLDAVLSTIANAFDDSLVAYGAESGM